MLPPGSDHHITVIDAQINKCVHIEITNQYVCLRFDLGFERDTCFIDLKVIPKVNIMLCFINICNILALLNFLLTLIATLFYF